MAESGILNMNDGIRCPVCARNVLTVRILNRVAFFCRGCDLLQFEQKAMLGFMEVLADQAGARVELIAPDRLPQDLQKSSTCSICRGEMGFLPYMGDPRTVLDHCSRCGIIGLDSRRLSSALHLFHSAKIRAADRNPDALTMVGSEKRGKVSAAELVRDILGIQSAADLPEREADSVESAGFPEPSADAGTPAEEPSRMEQLLNEISAETRSRPVDPGATGDVSMLLARDREFHREMLQEVQAVVSDGGGFPEVIERLMELGMDRDSAECAGGILLRQAQDRALRGGRNVPINIQRLILPLGLLAVLGVLAWSVLFLTPAGYLDPLLQLFRRIMDHYGMRGGDPLHNSHLWVALFFGLGFMIVTWKTHWLPEEAQGPFYWLTCFVRYLIPLVIITFLFIWSLAMNVDTKELQERWKIEQTTLSPAAKVKRLNEFSIICQDQMHELQQVLFYFDLKRLRKERTIVPLVLDQQELVQSGALSFPRECVLGQYHMAADQAITCTVHGRLPDQRFIPLRNYYHNMRGRTLSSRKPEK